MGGRRHMVGRGHIQLEITDRLTVRSGHAGLGGQVEDHGRAPHPKVVLELRCEHVVLEKLGVRGHLVTVSGGEIIDHEYPFTVPQ